MKKLHSALCLCLMCALLLTCAVSAVGDNSAPIAENMEITTYRNTAVSGRLAASDPEGEELTFEITTDPIKGDIVLGENGEYTYTPREGKKGKDYFGYKAIDASGNSSHEATVIIRIEKPKAKMSYSDMADNGAHYASLRLAEKEIFVGQCLGGEYVFEPHKAVTRGEFLTMCMKLADEDILSGVSRTGFADDEDIPEWMRPYVSTALMCGAISGEATDAGAVFSPDRAISGNEATVMLNNIMGYSDVSYVIAGEDTPQWAAQAVMNLSANRVIMSGEAQADVLTRAEAAMILLRAMEG